MPIEEIANLRGISVGTVISHLERLIAAGEEIDLAYLKPSDDRFEKIKSAFQKSGGMNLSPVRGIIGEQFSYEELRIVRLFLQN